jgi:hypothetical protein
MRKNGIIEINEYKKDLVERIPEASTEAKIAATSGVSILPKSKPSKAPVLTEDLGKTVEFAICQAIGTEFKGNFKYCMDRVKRLQERFSFLKPILDGYKYTGNESNLNDFEKEEIMDIRSESEAVKLYHLSVKTTKKKNDWKICPQLIGQPTRFTFCQKFGLDNIKSKVVLSDSALKDYITTHTFEMLDAYSKTTFHCPIFFYNEGSDLAMMISLVSPVDWSKFEFSFSHLEKSKSWNESITLYIKKEVNGKSKLITIGEFQFHNGRDCIKFRFHLKNILDNCKENFEIKTY